MTVREDIELRLQTLVGLPLVSVTRASDLQDFSFGTVRTVLAKYGRNAGQPRDVCEYALHVMCAWRLRDASAIVVASRDRYLITDDGDTWDRVGANRCDNRIAELVRPRLPLVVRAVCIGAVGAFSIEFDGDLALDVLPDDSGEDQHWRFFKPYDSAPHYFFEANQLKSE